ncbi:Glycosyl transferase family 2 [Georgenia satyanarayanai]|uniref:Glycosyl transferase family 2 n=1 Tax=Georgenia satyanarayanai TaxID=860221 RepID=A0A2Y9A492_9MICO|nr:glycosyltransferase family 2 protein [Georgenia satyanarayanai]PYG01082.1 glycosyl transferase family 2 [Georgenia satyanarayanai]SSA39321.1 Glycosyl transferase family 2 [Georgenia satyanarayanai]
MARQPDPTISAVLIVKDEEDYLARCLASVRWADEIVVYDTGSTDRTVEIARQFTDAVVEGYWNDNFGEARNRALEHATSDWVLIIDADETFEASARSVRRALREAQANFLTVTIAARVLAPGAADSPVASIRLFRRADGTYAGALHEQVVNRPGRPMVIRPLAGASIRHAGYAEGPEAMAERAYRNLELAQQELADARPSRDERPAEYAIKQANLARSLSAVGRADEALELAEEIHEGGALADIAMELLAGAMALAAARKCGKPELARTWVDRLVAVTGNRVWADIVLMQLAVTEGSAERTLDALDCIPTTMVDALGRRVRRVDYAQYEVWALWKLGRRAEALSAAERAARAGVLPGGPRELVTWLGEEGVRAFAGALPDDVWQVLAVVCTQDTGAEGRAVLDAMAQVRPTDLATLLCGSRLSFPHDLAGLEEAATWSARLRSAGMAEYCPLAATATDADVPALQRARAAALALFAYDDARALPALEAALGAVAPEDEAELAVQLDVLAPGLVSHA